MTNPKNPVWIELLQLLPVLSFAFPFIWAGGVELERAGPGFTVGALLTLPIGLVVARSKHLFNPILLGVGIWLWLGAIAFQLPLESVKAVLVSTQAFGMFVSVFLVGVAATWLSPHGYVGCRSRDSAWIRRASLGLLGVTALTVGWAWLIRHDVRLGGGAPFIVLNVTRRALGLRAPA
jgi:hypothetical protein